MATLMCWFFRSFGLRPQDDKRNPKDDKRNPKDDKRSPQDDKRSPQDDKVYVTLSAAKNLNAACHSERSEESKQKDPVSLY